MNDIYVNSKQKDFLSAQQRYKMFVGGRGSGKSTTLGLQNTMKLDALPGSKTAWAGLTYGQLLENVLPPAEEIWNSMGLREATRDQIGHYTIGVKPPSYFNKPVQAPRKFDNVISFINGYCIQMCSLDRPKTIRGLNADSLEIDEAGLIKKEWYEEILLPTVRGNIYRYDHYLHHSVSCFTSMPWLSTGQWVLDYQDLSKEYPDKYYYQESTAYDNIEALGEEYINNLRNSIGPLRFRVEVMNERVSQLPNSFYPDFDDERNCEYDNIHYDQNDLGRTYAKGRKDIRLDDPIDTSWDFNAAFNSCTTWQEQGDTLRGLKEFFIKDYKTYLPLVDEICDYFESVGHKKKVVNIYGDRNGNNRVANSELTFYEEIVNRFADRGWHAVIVVAGLDSGHKFRHHVVNQLFRENDSRFPKVRLSLNFMKYTIQSIKNTPIKQDFKKDKSSERQKIDQEKATHLSDTVDNYLIDKSAHCFGNNSAFHVPPTFF